MRLVPEIARRRLGDTGENRSLFADPAAYTKVDMLDAERDSDSLTELDR